MTHFERAVADEERDEEEEKEEEVKKKSVSISAEVRPLFCQQTQQESFGAHDTHRVII